MIRLLIVQIICNLISHNNSNCQNYILSDLIILYYSICVILKQKCNFFKIYFFYDVIKVKDFSYLECRKGKILGAANFVLPMYINLLAPVQYAVAYLQKGRRALDPPPKPSVVIHILVQKILKYIFLY